MAAQAKPQHVRHTVRPFAVDGRLESHLAWLQRVTILATDGRPPSRSQLLRRAVGLLVDHLGALIEAGQEDGLPGPSAQAVEVERVALAEYARIVPADLPRTMVNAQGQLQGWLASLAASPATAPTAARGE